MCYYPACGFAIEFISGNVSDFSKCVCAELYFIVSESLYCLSPSVSCHVFKVRVPLNLPCPP